MGGPAFFISWFAAAQILYFGSGGTTDGGPFHLLLYLGGHGRSRTPGQPNTWSAGIKGLNADHSRYGRVGRRWGASAGQPFG